MTMLTIGSLTGAPGVTTTALALVRQHPVAAVLIEADPDGGRLASRLEIGHRPGLVDLLMQAHHRGPHDLFDGIEHPDPRSPARFVPAHPSGSVVTAALRSGVHELITVLLSASINTVCDIGRYRVDAPTEPLITAAARRIVITGSQLGDIVVLSHELERLRSYGPLTVVVTGTGTYDASEIARAMDMAVIALPPPGSPIPGRRYLRALESLHREVWSLQEQP
jgi:hypothetical protein